MSSDARAIVAPGARGAPAARAATPAESARLTGAPALAAVRLAATSGLLLAVVSLAVCGWFARWASHAFQMADLLRRSGFIGGQVVWYDGWTGRFGANALWLVAVAPGPWFVRIQPALFLLGWGAALWWTLPRVAERMGLRLRGTARLLAATVLLFATLAAAPALWFDLFKLTGSITYITPLALGTAVTGVAVHCVNTRRISRGSAVALALGAVLAAGFSDTYSGVQPLVLVLLATCGGMVACRRRRRVAVRAAVLVAAGTLAGEVLLLSAPGNAVRRSLYPKPPHLTVAVARSIHDGWNLMVSVATHSTGLVLLTVAAAFLLLGATSMAARAGASRVGLTRRRAAAGVLATLAVVAASHLPAEELTSAPPPARSELIPVYALVLGLAYLAWCCGVSLTVRRAPLPARLRSDRRLATAGLAVAVAAMLAAPAMTMAWVAQSWHSMSAYAAGEDREWRILAQARPHSDVAIPGPRVTGIGPLSHDPIQEVQTDSHYWINQSVAEYFGLHSVHTATATAVAWPPAIPAPRWR